MTGLVMEIRRNKWESQRTLPLDKGLRDATADYLRAHCASAKHAARRFGLTPDQARSSFGGKASLGTIERIFKTGGWTVALAILADVIGTGIANYIAELRANHEQNGGRLAALVGDSWPWGDVGRVDPAGGAQPVGERRQLDRRRMG